MRLAIFELLFIVFFSCDMIFCLLFFADVIPIQRILRIFVNKIFIMEKINRRTFLRRTGISTAALAVGAYGKALATDITYSAPDGVAEDGASATGADKGTRYEALLADNGRALVNPMMGWTMHF